MTKRRHIMNGDLSAWVLATALWGLLWLYPVGATPWKRASESWKCDVVAVVWSPSLVTTPEPQRYIVGRTSGNEPIYTLPALEITLPSPDRIASIGSLQLPIEESPRKIVISRANPVNKWGVEEGYFLVFLSRVEGEPDLLRIQESGVGGIFIGRSKDIQGLSLDKLLLSAISHADSGYHAIESFALLDAIGKGSLIVPELASINDDVAQGMILRRLALRNDNGALKVLGSWFKSVSSFDSEYDALLLDALAGSNVEVDTQLISQHLAASKKDTTASSLLALLRNKVKWSSVEIATVMEHLGKHDLGADTVIWGMLRARIGDPREIARQLELPYTPGNREEINTIWRKWAGLELERLRLQEEIIGK